MLCCLCITLYCIGFIQFTSLIICGGVCDTFLTTYNGDTFLTIYNDGTFLTTCYGDTFLTTCCGDTSFFIVPKLIWIIGPYLFTTYYVY